MFVSVPYSVTYSIIILSFITSVFPKNLRLAFSYIQFTFLPFAYNYKYIFLARLYFSLRIVW